MLLYATSKVIEPLRVDELEAEIEKMNSKNHESVRITDIKVLVPNKEVELTFQDGKKIHMTCDESDKFNLEKCCFIGLAKYLYKGVLTCHGLEVMAYHLSCFKVYDKMVRAALMNYRIDEARKKREKEISEEIRRNRAEKERRKRIKRAQKKTQKTQKESYTEDEIVAIVKKVLGIQ